MKQQNAEKSSQEVFQAEQRKQAQAEQGAREVLERQRAFQEAFPTPEAQVVVFAEFFRRVPWAPKGQIGRNLAIQDWWEGQSLTCTVKNSTIGGACA